MSGVLSAEDIPPQRHRLRAHHPLTGYWTPAFSRGDGSGWGG